MPTFIDDTDSTPSNLPTMISKFESIDYYDFLSFHLIRWMNSAETRPSQVEFLSDGSTLERYSISSFRERYDVLDYDWYYQQDRIHLAGHIFTKYMDLYGSFDKLHVDIDKKGIITISYKFSEEREDLGFQLSQ